MKTAIRHIARPVIRPVRRLVGATCMAYALSAGIGDHLMLSTVARELKRRGRRRIFLITEFPDLFVANPDLDRVAARGSRLSRLLPLIADEHPMWLTYHIHYDYVTKTRDQPPEPVLAYLCRAAGVTGRVDLRPYLFLTEEERARGEPYRGCVAVQSSGLSARSPALNKEWYPERFAEVAGHLLASHPVVQVGHAQDPPVPCTHDLRGQTTIRQLAAVLAHCRMLVSYVGMTMHLARAVECPSVIVYGGRERPDQTGYVCNENVYNPVPCAPCWLDCRCDHGRICLETLSASAVIEAAERMLARPRDGLAVASYEIR